MDGLCLAAGLCCVDGTLLGGVELLGWRAGRCPLTALRLDVDLFGGRSTLDGASLDGGAMLRGRQFAWRSRVALTEQLTLLIFSLSLLFRYSLPPRYAGIIFSTRVRFCGFMMFWVAPKNTSPLCMRVLFLIPVDRVLK